MRIAPKTIRGQIVAAFLVCFVFMAIIIAVNYQYLHRLSSSMMFFALAEDVNNAILEMRRFEKNYFLYHQNFDFEENLTYTNNLELLLIREEANLTEIIGSESYARLVENVRAYSELMTQLHQTDCEVVDCTDLETRIRGTGQHLLTVADQSVETERRTIEEQLRQMSPLPLFGLLGLVVLLAFVIFFIGEKVIRPLARITRETEGIAEGAYHRLTAYGNRGNEIHHLISRINHMMAELEKRQEQLVQSRKIASIGTLTAGIAHEINNPVNNISLILESLIEQSDQMTDEEKAKLYSEAMDQADRTSDIVKNLLEFSRSSARRIEAVDLVEVVDKTARLVANEMKLNKIHFEKVIKSDIPLLQLDRGGMQQVLLNLFLNAIQAIGDGGLLKVVIGFSKAEGEVRLDVIDDGPGIPEHYLNQVFDPFFTTKNMGTGLGLSVSYNIVKKNGGTMEVQSRQGEGARLTIVLPVG